MSPHFGGGFFVYNSGKSSTSNCLTSNPVLFHFCSSGIQNNLHATLYHFIIQGKKQQLWKTEDQDVLRKLDRLPSKYTDLIELFHRLLDECFVLRIARLCPTSGTINSVQSGLR
jgi:hypothetical protein